MQVYPEILDGKFFYIVLLESFPKSFSKKLLKKNSEFSEFHQLGPLGFLKKKLKGHFFGQNTENPRINLKGKMYVRKISLDLVNPWTFTNLVLPV